MAPGHARTENTQQRRSVPAASAAAAAARCQLSLGLRRSQSSTAACVSVRRIALDFRFREATMATDCIPASSADARPVTVGGGGGDVRYLTLLGCGNASGLTTTTTTSMTSTDERSSLAHLLLTSLVNRSVD